MVKENARIGALVSKNMIAEPEIHGIIKMTIKESKDIQKILEREVIKPLNDLYDQTKPPKNVVYFDDYQNKTG